MTLRPWLAGLALVLVGCGSHAASRSASFSGSGNSAGAYASRTPYRGPTTSTRPYATAPAAPYVAGPTAPRVGPGPMTTAPAPRATTMRPAVPDARFWRGSLDEAMSDARTSGRLVFLEMGRDGCGNCQALRNKVIPDPQIDGPLKALSVGWYDDVDRNRETRARSILYQNLPNAVMLPLAGWVTSDMRWVSGFSGRQTTDGFLREIAKANAIYRQRTEAERPVPRAEMGYATPPPATPPSRDTEALGSLPADEMADVTAALGEDALPAVPPAVVAIAAPAEPPPQALEPAPVPETLPVAPPPVPAAPPVTETARVDPAPPAEPAPSLVVPPVVAPPVGETPAAPVPDPVRAWAHQELERAATALAARDYAGARVILAEVRSRAQGLPEQREAEKGEVAIRALKKIDQNGGDVAVRVRSDAARDLRGTIWVTLFA